VCGLALTERPMRAETARAMDRQRGWGSRPVEDSMRGTGSHANVAKSAVRTAGLLMAVLTVSLAQGVAAQQPAQDERIAASFILALGRTPTAKEADEWGREAGRPVADLVARHRTRMQSAPAEQKAVLERASRDAFGVAPGAAPGGLQMGAGIYVDVLQREVRWLESHPDDYLQVVQRAYQAVLTRDAYTVEVDYWRKRPVIPFALLVACIDNWALRSQPGLTATSGVPAASINCRYLASARLSVAAAAEARALVGLAPLDERSARAAIGAVVVAPGAGEIVSVGGIPFAAAGSSAIEAAVGVK
jgi:hypothetical protein